MSRPALPLTFEGQSKQPAAVKQPLGTERNTRLGQLLLSQTPHFFQIFKEHELGFFGKLEPSRTKLTVDQRIR